MKRGTKRVDNNNHRQVSQGSIFHRFIDFGHKRDQYHYGSCCVA